MPETTVVSPFAITYDGNDADKHIISAAPLGRSIIGASKLYTTVVHYCMFGYIPRGNYKRDFECYAMPAHERCFEYQVLLAALGTEWVLHGPIYKEGLDFIFAKVVDAIKNVWVKPSEIVKVTEHLAEVMKEQAKQNTAVQTVLANGLIKATDNMAALHGKLIDTLPKMALVTRSSGAELVAPVGTTCKVLRQFSRTQDETIITEPDAEVIRGDPQMEVGDLQQFGCRRITEINRTNGHCILDLEGFDRPVIGKIDDPALQEPNNVYTRALNDLTPVLIIAKPVMKNGVVHKLFISDAKPRR
jgi:hypothetical protein